MTKEKKNTSKKRAWLWVVTPILFLIIGAGAFVGLNYFLEEKFEILKKTAETNIEEKTIEEPVEESHERGVASDETEKLAAEIAIAPSPFAGNPQNVNGTNSSTTYDAVAHEIGGVKYVYYKTMVWGTVEANFEEFRAKVTETLSDARGWMRAGLKFVEVSEGQDLNIILSDPASLEGYNGYCSGELSCTSGYNEVIINDVRWREGTDATTGAGLMNLRDYQTMVINHEVGHWLGHYQHVEACSDDGGVAPIMLQQSTGLRNCGGFNPWPLDEELWILR